MQNEKLTVHIAFFYIHERMKYVDQIISNMNTYEFQTDVFIHTNNSQLMVSNFNKNYNGIIQIISHDLSECHPFFLTWKCRELMSTQKDKYDYFMYLEDDILVPLSAIKYWLKYHPKCESQNYNLGFLRIETDSDKVEYITDLQKNKRFTLTTDLEGEMCVVNNINPYCAFWIYNKDTFIKFVNSPLYKYENMSEFGNNTHMIREKSAIGLNGLSTRYYSKTVIPIKNYKVDPDCRVLHLPNNYVNRPNSIFATIPFNDAIDKKLVDELKDIHNVLGK